MGAKRARACRGRGVACHARAVAAAHTPLFGFCPRRREMLRASKQGHGVSTPKSRARSRGETSYLYLCCGAS